MSIKVLIIEDDKDIRRHLQRLLEMEGYIVEVADNGKMALDHLNSTSVLPKMIILDLMMPVMDGFEFRAQQLTLPHIAAIPVAIMTAGGQVKEKAVALGVKAAIRKPADIEEILKIVKELSAAS